MIYIFKNIFLLSHKDKLLKLFLILMMMIFIILFFKSNNCILADNNYYPLIVYAGSPEGVMSAVGASREGTKTLLIMKREKPGGLMTYGGLNYLDLNHGPEDKNLNRGLFSEWHRQVGGKVTFSINRATEVFQDMLANESNLKVYNNAELIDVKRNDNRIEKIIIDRGYGPESINTDVVIDASQDADLAVKADVPYFKGGADIGLEERHMAVTLVLHLGNINWNELLIDARSKKFGPTNINKNHAWGFVEIGKLYNSVNKNAKMRGLNIVIENRGTKSEVYINSLLIFNTDPTDEKSLERAYRTGKTEAGYILEFLRENLSGFSQAELLEFPPELYIRESRHILSRYQLKVEDLFYNRIFEDTIALASYPLDYQASTSEYGGFVLFNPDIYGIPLRSIVPSEVSNLMVVGRSSGYSSLAAASTRVLPTGMTTAEAAGRIAAYSIKDMISIEEILNKSAVIEKIQEKLQIKSYIEKYNDIYNKPLINNYNKHPVLPHLVNLLSWGLISGGYNNDFKFEENIKEKDFSHLIVKGLQQRESSILYEWVPGGLETMSSSDLLTRDNAAMLLLVAISKKISEIDKEEYYSTAVELGLIPDYIKQNVKRNRLLNRAEAYIILSHFFQQYPVPEHLKIFRGEK